MSAKIMSGICLAMLLAGCGGSDDDKHFSPAADWAKEDSARVWDRG